MGMDKTMTKIQKIFYLRLTALLIVAGIIASLEQNMVWNLTSSVKPSLMYRSDGIVKKGDYVTFFLKHPYLKNGSKEYRLTKLYRCGPGDILVTKGQELYCNEKRVATTLTHTASGKPLIPFQWNGPIPEGRAFVLGDDPESFDSRYWGFVAIDNLERLTAIL